MAGSTVLSFGASILSSGGVKNARKNVLSTRMALWDYHCVSENALLLYLFGFRMLHLERTDGNLL
jgi:hypothetical protein